MLSNKHTLLLDPFVRLWTQDTRESVICYTGGFSAQLSLGWLNAEAFSQSYFLPFCHIYVYIVFFLQGNYSGWTEQFSSPKMHQIYGGAYSSPPNPLSAGQGLASHILFHGAAMQAPLLGMLHDFNFIPVYKILHPAVMSVFCVCGLFFITAVLISAQH